MRHGWRRRIGIAAVLVLSAGVAACGVKSAPRSPDGATHPRPYPKPLPPLATEPREPERRTGPGAPPDSFYQYPNLPR